MTTSYYKPSGKISSSFFLYYILFLAICVPIISAIYIYAVFYIPFIYANFLVALGCGIVMAFLLMKVVEWGKARSPIVVLAFTILAACILSYVKWCIYIPLVLSEVYGFTMTIGERFSHSLTLFLRPAEVFDAARFINDVGVWTFEGSVVNGGGLLVIWIIEFGIITGLAVMAFAQAKLPFSEEAGNWYIAVCQKVEMDIPANLDTLKSELESGRSGNFVQQATVGRTNETNFLRLSFHQPPEGSFGEPYFMTVEETTIKRGKTKTKNLISQVAINAGSAREILAGAPAVLETNEDSE